MRKKTKGLLNYDEDDSKGSVAFFNDEARCETKRQITIIGRTAKSVTELLIFPGAIYGASSW